jgi:hypothetical protein
MVFAFFWAIHRHLKFKCQHFGTLCLFHHHRPMKMEQSVPKCWHLNFRCWWITQKKAYNYTIMLALQCIYHFLYLQKNYIYIQHFSNWFTVYMLWNSVILFTEVMKRKPSCVAAAHYHTFSDIMKFSFIYTTALTVWHRNLAFKF